MSAQVAYSPLAEAIGDSWELVELLCFSQPAFPEDFSLQFLLFDLAACVFFVFQFSSFQSISVRKIHIISKSFHVKIFKFGKFGSLCQLINLQSVFIALRHFVYFFKNKDVSISLSCLIQIESDWELSRQKQQYLIQSLSPWCSTYSFALCFQGTHTQYKVHTDTDTCMYSTTALRSPWISPSSVSLKAKHKLGWVLK